MVVCLAAAWVALPQAADDPLDSLKVCKDTQHLILENQFVRVIDDQIPVGVTEPLHRHRHGVVVYVNTYTNEQISQDGKRTVGERKAGTASWVGWNRAYRQEHRHNSVARDPDRVEVLR